MNKFIPRHKPPHNWPLYFVGFLVFSLFFVSLDYALSEALT